ncbi:hypothetical protein ACHHYP_05915 [Achlya hypogyna]|uniref:HIT-type domain-containing protein n=1 Tax=Achlya hypogyna TaxID=1202772 RepID=A0A1V9YVW3_ACHHY|nr:hypothetical protein ACHHYP_05915 [Achlya hypogyna]
MSALVCAVCREAASKYKCPACRLRYCSAACYKVHKETACGPPAATKAAPSLSTPAQTAISEPMKPEPSSKQPEANVMNESVASQAEPAVTSEAVHVKSESIVNSDPVAVLPEATAKIEPATVQPEPIVKTESVADQPEPVVAEPAAMELAGPAEPTSLAPPTPATEDVENVHLLSKAQLGVIASSPAILQALENPQLRARIQQIDGHANRLYELQKALTDPSFAEFVFGMMDEVSRVKD